MIQIYNMQRQKLVRVLTIKEEQAYQGAYDFYRIVIPAAMITSMISHLYPTFWQESTRFDYLLKVIILGMITISSYFIAFRFYKQCNLIETTPVLSSVHSTSLETSNEKLEGEDHLLGTAKPQRYFCGICKITCNYRTRHCRKCGVCIERYDHHCFWIGNCVGRHNHRQFYFFLLAQTINNVSNFILIYDLQNLSGWKFWVQLLSGITAFGFCCFTGYLLIYHSMLISCGITTWQHMRRPKISYLKYLPSGYNPFSLGIFENWREFMKQQTRGSGSQMPQDFDDKIISFEEAKQIKPVFNIIENQYYSCC